MAVEELANDISIVCTFSNLCWHAYHRAAAAAASSASADVHPVHFFLDGQLVHFFLGRLAVFKGDEVEAFVLSFWSGIIHFLTELG